MRPERGGAGVLKDGVGTAVGGDVQGGNGVGVVAVGVGGGREEGVEVGGG